MATQFALLRRLAQHGSSLRAFMQVRARQVSYTATMPYEKNVTDRLPKSVVEQDGEDDNHPDLAQMVSLMFRSTGSNTISDLNAKDIRTLQAKVDDHFRTLREKFDKLKGNVDASQIKDFNREVDELKAAATEEKKDHLITQGKLETGLTLATIEQLQTEIQELKSENADQASRMTDQASRMTDQASRMTDQASRMTDQASRMNDQASRMTLLEEKIHAQKEVINGQQHLRIMRQCAMDVESRVMLKIWPKCRKKPYYLRSIQELNDLVLKDSAYTLDKESNTAWGELEEDDKTAIRKRFAVVQKDLDLEELSLAVEDTKDVGASGAHCKYTSDQLTKTEQWAVTIGFSEETCSAFTTVRKAWAVLMDQET